MRDYQDHRVALEALLNVPTDLELVLEVLSDVDRTPVQPSVTLHRRFVRAALEAFTHGSLPAALLERWAETIHTMEDIDFDPTDRDFLADAIFQLSTPELFGSMEEIVSELAARDQQDRATG